MFTLTRLLAVLIILTAVRVRLFAVSVPPPVTMSPLVVSATPLQHRCVAPMERQPEVRCSVSVQILPPVLHAVSLLLHTEIVRLQAVFTLTLLVPTRVRFVGSTVSFSVMLPVLAVALTVLLSSAPEPLMSPPPPARWCTR